jgi:hypothetical protein
MIDVSYALCIWKMCCNDIGRMDGQTADINTPLQHMWKNFLSWCVRAVLIAEIPEECEINRVVGV